MARGAGLLVFWPELCSFRRSYGTLVGWVECCELPAGEEAHEGGDWDRVNVRISRLWMSG